MRKFFVGHQSAASMILYQKSVQPLTGLAYGHCLRHGLFTANFVAESTNADRSSL